MPMKNPPDPGLSVRYDCLDPLDLKNVKHGPVLSMGERGYRLQTAYDFAQAMKRADDIKVEEVE